MPRTAQRLACVAAAACLLGGCGADQSRRAAAPRTTATAQRPAHALSDPALAHFGLLPRASMPLRVTGSEEIYNRSPCSPRVLLRRLATGLATTPRYTISGGRVQQSVLLFRSPAVAAHAFDALTSPRNQRCIRRHVRIDVAAGSGSPVGSVTEQAMNVEPRGQQATAYRLLVPVYAANGDAFVDVLINRIGRSLSSVSAIWTQAPHDIAFQEALVARIASRLAQALA